MENLKKEVKEIDPEEEEDEINTTYCPYKKVTNFFGNIFGGNSSKVNDSDSPKLSTSENEKAKCPFGYVGEKATKKNKPPGKCPFGFGAEDEEKGMNFPDKKENVKTNKDENEKNASDEDEDSGDDEPQGGCPVMNKGRKDPANKDFEPFYEIPCFGNYDFIFFLRGGLSQEEWIEKTKKMRKYPRHMRYTLFYQAQEKLQEVHKAEFPRVFFIYDDIKQKGIRFYNRKKYREALEHMNYAYGLLKWIEFKDKKRQADFVVKPSLDGVLDEEIEEKHVYLDAPDVEEESYKACVIYLLEIMAYSYMELRHYSCAIECLNECAEIAGNLVPDVYFRRAQARMYNKNSTDEDIKLAKEDMEKAIKLGESFNAEIKQKYDETSPIYKRIIDMSIYYKTSQKLDKMIEDKIINKIKNVRRILGTSKDEEEMNNDELFLLESCIFARPEDMKKQYKILKEMKSKYNLAVKFFTETKNKEQLELTYKEYESFHETFEQFKYFYKFEINSLDSKIINRLNEEEKKMLEDPNTPKLIEKHKTNLCEFIFSRGNFNIELYKFALDKIFGEERAKMEEQRKKEEAMRPKVSWTQYLMKLTKGNFSIYISICFIIFTLGAIGFQIFSSSAGIGSSGLGIK